MTTSHQLCSSRRGGSVTGLYVEEEKRPYPILRLSLHLFRPEFPPACPPPGLSPGKQLTVSSAPLNGRWYLQVPAAWGRAVILPNATAATTTPPSKRDQLSGTSEIQPRNPLPFSIASRKPISLSEPVHDVWPGPSRTACHDEWRSGPSAVWHADPQVPVAKSSSTPRPTTSPPHAPHTNCA